MNHTGVTTTTMTGDREDAPTTEEDPRPTRIETETEITTRPHGEERVGVEIVTAAGDRDLRR